MEYVEQPISVAEVLDRMRDGLAPKPIAGSIVQTNALPGTAYPAITHKWRDPVSAERNPYMDPWVDQDPQHAARLDAVALASLPTKIENQIKIYAQARFPHISEEERLQRYRFIDGQIAYLRDDGYLQAEAPRDRIDYGAASLAGPAISNVAGFAGGGIVGALSGPFAPITGSYGAMLGAMGGEALGEYVAKSCVLGKP